ncbi:MAG: hypothetical protein Q9174_007249 [Haloplaca sp. 1 TL-2023]
MPKFPEKDFVADVYVSGTGVGENAKVWLIDINPFAERTDPLLFSWSEILALATRNTNNNNAMNGDAVPVTNGHDDHSPEVNGVQRHANGTTSRTQSLEHSDSDSNEAMDVQRGPELRLLSATDQPRINTSQYSAHKLPRDVVDATSHDPGAGMAEFMTRWRDIVKEQEGRRNGDEK